MIDHDDYEREMRREDHNHARGLLVGCPVVMALSIFMLTGAAVIAEWVGLGWLLGLVLLLGLSAVLMIAMLGPGDGRRRQPSHWERWPTQRCPERIAGCWCALGGSPKH